jgi:transcriptional regulator GlxA family with amidase domain
MTAGWMLARTRRPRRLIPGRGTYVIVHQVQLHIDLHLDGPLPISELAARFGLSERTLSRRVATATGHEPVLHAWLAGKGRGWVAGRCAGRESPGL